MLQLRMPILELTTICGERINIMNTFQRTLGLSLSLLSLVACGSPRLLPANSIAGSQNLQRPGTTRVSAKWVTKNQEVFVPNQIVVGYKVAPGAFRTQQVSALSASSLNAAGLAPKQSLQVKDQAFTLLESKLSGGNLQAQLAKLRANPQYNSVELNPRYRALGTAPRPLSYSSGLRSFNTAPVAGQPAAVPQVPALNDMLYRQQWALPKIGIPTGWEQGGQGSKNIMIAIIDSGVDYNHPDLKGQIINGKDFMADFPSGPNGDGSSDTIDDDPLDQMGHGTHVAGVIAAIPNNQTGVAGIAPGVKVLNIKALNGEGWGSAFAIAQGITYATDQGARVINLSLGSPETSKPIELAIKYAQEKGVLLVAAAGNDYTHTSFPANYPGVLAVGATDDQDGLASFSNHDENIDVVAPGVDIISTTPTFMTHTMANQGIDSFYSTMSGTSMAAPMVTAMAGLLLSQAPQLNPVQLTQLIQSTCKNLGDPRLFGHGRIQIEHALRTLRSAQPPANGDAVAAQAFRRR